MLDSPRNHARGERTLVWKSASSSIEGEYEQIRTVSNDLHHDSLTRCCHNPVKRTSCQQALVACGESLPYICQDNKEAADDADGPAAEDVAQWDDQNVGESQRDNVETCEQRERLLPEMEFGAQERKQWSKGECRAHQHPNVKQLRDCGDDFPRATPIQRICWVASWVRHETALSVRDGFSRLS